MDMIEMLPPQNLEAEQFLLGAVLLDGGNISKITGFLCQGDFYSSNHGIIYEAMCELHKSNIAVDIITLTESLKKSGSLERVGGLAYLSRMAKQVMTTGMITHHAKIIRELSLKRQIINICRDAISRVDFLTVDEIIAKVRNSFASLLTGHGGEIISMFDIAKKVSEYIDNRMSKDIIISGVPSGFADLDEVLDGFQDGQLYIVGARPGMGKTAFSMSIAQNAGVPVGRIDLEMAGLQLGMRSLSNISQITLYKLRKGYISRDEMQNVMSSIAKIANLPIYFSLSSYDIASVEQIVTQMIEKKGIKMLIVDYLQLISNNERKNREQEVADASRLMKRIAKTHNIPVLALAQLNRELEGRENKRPILKDLRESGQIEQDADVVMFLYRDKTKKDQTECEVIIAKGRNEGGGVVKLYFDGDRMTFSEETH